MHAVAAGFSFEPGTVLLLGNIVPIEKQEASLCVVHSYKYPEEKCREWAPLLHGLQFEGITFHSHHLAGEEVLLVLEGKASWEITDSDPIFAGFPILEVQPRWRAGEPGLAKRTAAAVNSFLREARRRLSREDESAAFITKWASRELPVEPFTRRWGLKSALVASGPLYRGMALKWGMGERTIVEATSAGDDLREKLREAERLLEEDLDLVIVHTKASDEASHTGSPLVKVRVLEEMDQVVGEFQGIFDDESILKVATGDHSTSSEGSPFLIHSGEPVPMVFSGRTVRRDEVISFDEVSCARGSLGCFSGRYLMPLLLNYLNRAAFCSAHPLPRDVPYLSVEGKPLTFGN
jgi:2,3-bisphosphoglycerate-independent phosphoglycerate mutase